MHRLKIVAVPGGLGVELTDDLLAHLGVDGRLKEGDTLFATETSTGAMLSARDPAITAQLEVGREIMHRYREALRVLAS